MAPLDWQVKLDQGQLNANSSAERAFGIGLRQLDCFEQLRSRNVCRGSTWTRSLGRGRIKRLV